MIIAMATAAAAAADEGADSCSRGRPGGAPQLIVGSDRDRRSSRRLSTMKTQTESERKRGENSINSIVALNYCGNSNRKRQQLKVPDEPATAEEPVTPEPDPVVAVFLPALFIIYLRCAKFECRIRCNCNTNTIFAAI